MTIREVLQMTCSTSLIFCVLYCSPTLIGATSVVAPFMVGLQKQKSVDVFSPTLIGATSVEAPS